MRHSASISEQVLSFWTWLCVHYICYWLLLELHTSGVLLFGLLRNRNSIKKIEYVVKWLSYGSRTGPIAVGCNLTEICSGGTYEFEEILINT